MIRSMMLALAGIVLAFVAATAVAQEKDAQQVKMEEQYAAKVAEPWFTNNGFTDDYDVARQRAKETGKPIFAYFTRSYAG